MAAHIWQFARQRLTVQCPYCTQPAVKRGMCNRHYLRDYRHGSPLHLERRAAGEGTVLRGYRLITVNGEQVYEHRHLMAEQSGRPLRADEVVHHIDGNTLNNAIENLEVLTRREHPTRHPDNLQAWQKAGLPARWKKETTRRK